MKKVIRVLKVIGLIVAVLFVLDVGYALVRPKLDRQPVQSIQNEPPHESPEGTIDRRPVQSIQNEPPHESPEGTIESFEYLYGSYFPGYCSFQITRIDNKPVLSVCGYNDIELNVEKPLREQDLAALAALINEAGIDRWDGFFESDSEILDGYSFDLAVSYDTGSTVRASGYMRYPAGYTSGHDRLTGFLFNLAGVEDPGI